MRKNVNSNLIIYNLRKNGKLSIADLLEAAIGERKFQKESLDASFAQILLDLINARFIEIVDETTSDGNKLSKFLKSLKFKRSQKVGLADGYKFMLKIKPESIFLKLTDYFFRVQDVIGFSISDDFKRKYRESIWGEINYKLKTQVFVIMPFSNDLRPIYENHILKVCNEIGYSCLRADEISAARKIMNDILSYINNADVIICDCTRCNPNVFYELGIAHDIGKNVICITQNKKDIPFDIKSIRYLKYSPKNMEQFEEKLEQYLADAMADTISKREIYY